MSLGVRTRRQMLEYSLLHNAKPAGRKIGLYMGLPIYEAVIDDYGQRYVFSGLAPRDARGEPDPNALSRGEFIVQPGLAYRIARLS